MKNNCKQCGNDFLPPNRGKRGRDTKFCGNSCALVWQKENLHHTLKNGIIKNCPSCNKKFYVRKGLSEQVYCNKNCFGISRAGVPRTEDSKLKTSITMASNISDGNFNPKTNCKHGYYNSTISGICEYYNSSYELTRMKQLDDRGIIWTKKHGLRIPYINSNGCRRYYVPDFLIRNAIIEEVKPVSLINKDNNPEKFLAALVYCHENNLEFHIITEKELNI